MRHLAARLLLIALLVCLGCRGEPGVIVTLEGVPADAVSVRARTLLNGAPGEELVLPAEQTRFVVRIPEPQRGDLVLDFKAQSRGGCTLAVGQLTVTLGGGLHPTQERRLVLSPLVAPMCTLTVQILAGEGELASEPAGLRCSGVGTCSAEFATGSTVRLVPTFDGSTEYLDWGGACVGSAGCAVAMDGHQQVQLTFAPRICMPDGGCWHSPLPQGRQLTALSVEEDHTVLAAGDAGTLLQCTGGRCTLRATAGTTPILSVVRSADGTVWATSGALQRCSGDGPCISVATPGSVQRLWATRSGEVWGVGVSGSIVRCSGASCARIESGTTSPLLAIAGSPSDELFVVGQQGTVRKCSGASCAVVTSGTTAGLTSVWVDSDGTAWAAGASGTVLRCRDSRCDVAASGGTRALASIAGAGAGSVFAAGASGTLLRCTAAGCEPLATATTRTLYSVWVGGDGQAWAVGDEGVVLRCGAAGCTAVAARTRSPLRSVSGNRSGEVWAVGDGGVMRRCAGDACWGPSAEDNPPGGLWDLTGTASGEVFAVGDNGRALRCSGGACARPTGLDETPLYRVWGSRHGDVWIAGNRGTVLRCSDGACTLLQPVNKDLRSIWGNDSGVWVAGFDGTVLRCSKAGCAPVTVPAGTIETLSDMAAEDLISPKVWAVGAGGRILWCSSAADCQTISSGTSADLFSVSVNSSGDAWVAGSGGVVLKCLSNRTPCTALKTGSTALFLYKIVADADGSRLAVGEVRTSSTATGMLVRCGATQCDVVAMYPDAVLSGVAVGPGGTVWAVGKDSIVGGGLVVQCKKGAPCALRSRAIVPSLNRVWAGSRDEAWMVTAEGSLLRIDP
ncbi:MAG: hypothetical protein U1A78_39055 [Polyangia bacterium]